MKDFKRVVAFHGLPVTGTALRIRINKHNLEISPFQTGGNVDGGSGFPDPSFLVNKTNNHLDPPF
jgi:hypothetical protein